MTGPDVVSLLRRGNRPTRRSPRHRPAAHEVQVLLADLHEHDQRGYGRWGAGLRHRVEDALGWRDHDDAAEGRS